MTAEIQTVRGPIPAAEAGITLPHEHFFVTTATANLALPPDTRDTDLAQRPVSREIRDWLEFNWHCNIDNLTLSDPETAFDEAGRYRQAGGRTVVDVTSIGIGRDPVALKVLSENSALNIVMGSGYYVGATHPADVARMDSAEIQDQILREFSEGIGDTGIRPGVIGEIGCSWPLLANEAKVLQSAGGAQKRLGAALYIHPGKHPDAPFQILSILEKTGADIEKVVICHIERTIQVMGKLKSVLQSGCTIEYDLFGMETTGFYYRSLGIDMLSDAQRLDQLRELIDAGFLRQVIISHDVCFKHRLHKFGGHGYDHILTNTVPWMRQRGFTESEISPIMIENPRRLPEMQV
jgi:phosphotriesterase-related protein